MVFWILSDKFAVQIFVESLETLFPEFPTKTIVPLHFLPYHVSIHQRH